MLLHTHTCTHLVLEVIKTVSLIEAMMLFDNVTAPQCMSVCLCIMQELSGGLQTKLTLMEDTSRQQIADLEAQVESRNNDIADLHSQLKRLQSQAQSAEALLRESKWANEVERKVAEKLHSNLVMLEQSESSLQSQLTDSKEKALQLQAKVEQLMKKLHDALAQNESLIDQLDRTRKSLSQHQQEAMEERESHSKAMSDGASQHKAEVHKLTAEIERSTITNRDLHRKLANREASFDNVRLELSATCKKLSKAEEECKKLRSTVEVETVNGHKLISKLSNLQAQLRDREQRITQLQDKIHAKSVEAEEAKLHAKGMQEHCEHLQHELKLQKEVMRSTVERLEDKGDREAAELMQNVRELSQKLGKVKICCCLLCMHIYLY